MKCSPHGRGVTLLIVTAVALAAPPRAAAQLVITKHPSDQTVQVGGAATFSVDATPSRPAVLLVVSWQASADGGKTFKDVSDGIYVGAMTTLMIPGVTAAMNGHQYRAKFVAYEYDIRYAPIYSDAATLTVTDPPPDIGLAHTHAAYACWCAYEAYLAGGGSLTTLYAAYLAWDAAGRARDLLAAGDAARARGTSEAAGAYAYCACLFGLDDYATSGDPWSYAAAAYGYYAYTYALSGAR